MRNEFTSLLLRTVNLKTKSKIFTDNRNSLQGKHIPKQSPCLILRGLSFISFIVYFEKKILFYKN